MRPAATRTLYERVANRDRMVVLAGLACVAGLAFVLMQRSGDRVMMASMSMPYSAAFALLLLAMWWTMMMAMMLPSAAPAILTYAAMTRKFSAQGSRQAPVAVFVAGYGMVWTLLSLAAVTLQIAARPLVPLSMMMAVTSGVVSGGLLIAAGIYQFTPLKQACLRHCQSPLMFFARNWRKGWGGAFRMGVSHGLYCLGCCWVLMGLLFYGGVMELSWIAGLAVYVALEKLVPVGHRLSWVTGAILIAWGLWTVAGAVLR